MLTHVSQLNYTLKNHGDCSTFATLTKRLFVETTTMNTELVGLKRTISSNEGSIHTFIPFEISEIYTQDGEKLCTSIFRMLQHGFLSNICMLVVL